MLPVFLLACAVAETHHLAHLALAFFILHFLVYPASNGYNSYYDKDEESIGGLKNPPKVSLELYYVSLLFDLLALILSLVISLEFMFMILVYGLISKAYSHPSVRLKKYPFLGWLAAGIFQGYFTFLLSVMAVQDIGIVDTFNPTVQWPAILSSVLLLGSYPMTQIYQHAEDGRRGDRTISRVLGVLGTFYFTAAAFTVAVAGFFYYFITFQDTLDALLFLAFLSPVLIYFGSWYLKVRKRPDAADFAHTMKLNFISSAMLNAFFLYLLFS